MTTNKVVTSDQFIPKIQALQANPMAIQRLMLKTLSSLTEDRVVAVDPTNPFVFLMESAVTLASAGMMQNEALNRRQYPSVAINEEEVYLHMSDRDYADRFANPARTTITLLFDLDEVKSKAVPINSLDPLGPRKLTIPRHTSYVVADLVFTMQYPVDIQVQPHGGVTVLYDLSQSSPLQTLSSNRADWGISMISGRRYLRITLPVQQMTLLSQMAQLNAVTGFSKSYLFADQYYYCRAFTKDAGAASWKEIRTTHTDQVYDPNTPTVVLKVAGQTLKVHVPQIYFNNPDLTKRIDDSIRLDIYTTRGPMDVDLRNYNIGAFSARWLDYDRDTDSAFTAPLKTLSGYVIYGEEAVTGGSNALTFEELRDRVITLALNPSDIPITPNQLENSLDRLGYSLVTHLDNVTDRQYLATRTIPAPSNLSTVSGAGCTIHMLQSNMADLATHTDYVTDNGLRMTIKPNAVFQAQAGILQVVPKALVDGMIATGPEILSNTVNNAEFYFTPFYYVLDTSNNEFRIRPYRLDDPKITAKYFVEQNSTLQMNVSVKTHEVYVNDSVPGGSGYILAIELNTDEVFRAMALEDVFVQISYIMPGTTARVFIDGVLVSPIDGGTGRPVDDKYIYYFYLDSRYDIDARHNLILEPQGTPAALTTEFDLCCFISTQNYAPADRQFSDIEDFYNPASVTGYNPAYEYYGISHERITIRFGQYLDNLWRRARSVAEDHEFLRYATDVPAYYTSNVYLRDAQGNLVFTFNVGTNELETTLLYAAGDPVMTAAGNTAFETALAGNPALDFATWWASLSGSQQASYQVMAHRQSDYILDAQGMPQLVGGTRALKRQMEMLFIDGKYYFATNDATITYRKEVVDLITSWVTADIEAISDKLLEQTELFFYPKTTVGTIEAMVEDGRTVRLPAAQQWRVRYYMLEEKYNNAELRATVERTTIQVLSDAMDATTIALMDIVDKLKASVGDDILAADVSSNVFGVSDLTTVRYPAITLKDQSMRPSVGKLLVPLSNQTTVVRDAVTVEFVKHR